MAEVANGGVSSGGTRKTRIIVVDDEQDVANTVGRLLRGADHEVEVFYDPLKVVEAVRLRHFDAVVSDISMPQMSGFELMRSIRVHDLDMPFVLLTGVPSIDSARRAVEYGAYRYLLKPADREELKTAVRRAVFARRMSGLRREASEVKGGPSQYPIDISGLEVAYEMALERLWMAYHPVVRASDGEVMAYEALLRSESTALPGPLAILDAAEKLNRLNELGRAVRRVVAQPMIDAPGGSLLFVNLHPRDLMDEDLLRADTPLGQIAESVIFEITERASLDDTPQAVETVAWLRAQGYRVAVDDMGSGYAGLTSFALLEPDFVKVDMGLIRGVDSSMMKQKLVASVVGLCADLGVKVVAEGVETPGERDKCIELGVDYLQGFLFAKPGPPFPSTTW